MVSCGEAVGLRLLLLLHLGPQQELPLKAEVKELTGGKGQRPLSQQSFKSGPPPVKHCGSHGGGAVNRTPEYLRSQNLKSTEVQSAVLKDTRDKYMRQTERDRQKVYFRLHQISSQMQRGNLRTRLTTKSFCFPTVKVLITTVVCQNFKPLVVSKRPLRSASLDISGPPESTKNNKLYLHGLSLYCVITFWMFVSFFLYVVKSVLVFHWRHCFHAACFLSCCVLSFR